ncbi:MAG: phosphoglucosamine mutase [Candidatus Solibacter usitatus]|nr:phosphoglucosamine mutase [Candidatus Solibacter usitatus]
MARVLFGTDGIRGVAGKPPLDAHTVYAAGIALGKWAVGIHGNGSEVLIGMDTRESGPGIAGHIAAGLETGGATPRFAGLITTPGVAFLTRSRDFVAGVMISASHNPFEDNGIKVFDHSGFKLPDDLEHALEQDIFALLEDGVTPRESLPPVDEGLDAAYLDYLVGTFPHRLDGVSLVIDCANGAATHLGPELFHRLGATVTPIACSPDGRNINLDCGALHLGGLQKKVLETGAAAGVAFDGDADRCLFVSHSGRIVNGDAMMLLTADSMLSAGHLNDDSGQPTVVATVMSNLGLEIALRDRGVHMLRAPVGDKYVLEEMTRRGAKVGGEQSGHVIFPEFATTGDGMLTALQVLKAVQASGKDLDELTKDLVDFPQILVNVRVNDKRPLEQMPRVQQEIDSAIAGFGGAGRVLVRYSGTEMLARVMVEGPDKDRVESCAHHLAQVLKTELGG